jgi:hypothetical protein
VLVRQGGVQSEERESISNWIDRAGEEKEGRGRERRSSNKRGGTKGIISRIAPTLVSFSSDFAFASLPSGKQVSRAWEKSKRRRAVGIH